MSAHFPPDFVSGGTLVPDRQARGLRDRGWDVSVYAGALGGDRPPLEAWDEQVDGLPVRWISIGAFIGWSDPRNYDNPDVVADFSRHLEARRPDVVHLHSLQTLGGGMVEAAARSGAATVVTMHDFWWWCGRLFLVDKGWSPCSPVVDAGVCDCEGGRDWLAERLAVLHPALARADLVLAPSAAAAEVFAATGVPSDRLVVDENGLPSVPAVAPRSEPPERVRFRYAGGWNPMKGVHVLLDAAERLAADRPGGWELVVHADASRVLPDRTGPLPGPVRLAEPFAHGELDGVLAATDVLVVPSLMRESHSLLTREALLRGVPVVCSDSLGPESVVHPGRNGLVVPTGDAGALAVALASIVDEPAVLPGWSAAAVGVEVRTEEEQIDGLDGRLRDLLAARPVARHAGGGEGTVRRVLFVVGIEGAPLRYRARLAAEALGLHGVEVEVRHYRDAQVRSLAGWADAVVVYRVPATVQVLDLLAEVKARKPAVPVLFDVDDLIFDPDLAAEIPALRVLPPDEAALWLDGVRRYRTTMEEADAFVGSTAALCAHAEAAVGLPAHRWANGVGLLLARRSDVELRRPRRPGPRRVGYLSGTTTHDRDWGHVEAEVLGVLDRHPDVELWLGGHLTPSDAVERLGPRLRRIPMTDWRDLPAIIRDLDVNLAPLEPLGRFNEAKSAIKWLEAALCATPTIAAATEPFREVVEPGVNGVLAGEPAEWGRALEELLGDAALRTRLGNRARRDALLGLSPHRQGERYLRILREARAAVAAGRVERASDWVPVAPDEPWEDRPLEPYELAPVPSPPDEDPGPEPRRVRARRAAARRVGATAEVWDAQGTRAAVRHAGQVLGDDARRVAAALRRRWTGGRAS
ncbi:MAG: glycosyltransferase [Acidimicrobiia bacterium]